MSGVVPPRAEKITFAARVERYADDVLSGRIVANKWVKAAARRQLDDLERAANGTWRYVFDPEACGRVCNWLQCMPHLKGRWARPVLVNGRYVQPRIVLEDWQVFGNGVPFGWIDQETGLRRFRWILKLVARKNAKSTPCAGLALYMTFCDGEPGAEGYSLATKEKQARIVWDMAHSIVRRDEEFRLPPPYGLGIEMTRRALSQLHTESKYEPLGRDSDTLDGLNPHVFVADELHAWRDRTLWDVMCSALGAREQPMGIAISTAGYNTAGICYEQVTYAQRVLNTTLLKHGGLGYKVKGKSIEDETYFALMYGLDTDYADGSPADNWADETKWIKANPNLGVSVDLDELREACKKALASPQAQAEFRTKRCNEFLAAAFEWMDMAKWDACADPTLSESDFIGDPCWIGLDAAFKTDIFAKVKLFRRGDHYYAFARYWVPESRLDEEEFPHLHAWHEEGLVEGSDGPVIDIKPIKEDIKADSERFDIRELPYDPKELTQFASEMSEDGYTMVEIPATFGRFSEPMKKLEELVLSEKFHHNGDPVLRWMITNVLCAMRGVLIYPTKQKGKERTHHIDGVIALLLALGRAMLADGGADLSDFLKNPVIV